MIIHDLDMDFLYLYPLLLHPVPAFFQFKIYEADSALFFSFVVGAILQICALCQHTRYSGEVC